MFGKNILFATVVAFFVLSGCATSEEEGTEKPGANVNTEAAEFGEDFGTTRSEFSSETASLTVSENIKLTFKNLDDAVAFLQESKILDQVAEVMPFGSEGESEPSDCMMMTPDGEMLPCGEGGFGDDFSPDGEFGPDGGDDFEEEPDSESFGDARFNDGPDGEEMEGDSDWEIASLGDDVVEFLEDNVFLDTQLESDEDGTIVYLLDPEIFCASDETGEPLVDAPSAQAFGPPEGGEPCEEKCPEGYFCVDGECYEAEQEWSDEEGNFEERDMFMDDGMQEESEGDDMCGDLVKEIPVRLQFTSKAEGEIQIALLFGDDKHNPIRFEMTSNLVALEVDLGAMLATVEDIIEVLDGGDEDGSGEEMEEMEQGEEESVELDKLAGVLRLSLEKTGEKKMRAAFGIVEKLLVEVTHGDDQYKAELGSLLLGAEADGANETVSAEFALEDLALTAPYASLVDLMSDEDCVGTMDMRPPDFSAGDGDEGEPWNERPDMMNEGSCDGDNDDDGEAPEGTMSLFLSGVSAAGTFSSEEEAESVQVTGIGLGGDTTTLKLDGLTLLSVDLNASDGRLFDLTFTVDDNENATLDFVPLLDLVVGMDMASVADEMEPPEWMIDETLSINFSGASVPSITILGEEEGEGMRVNAGTLTMSAASMPDKTITVEAGMCVVENKGDEEEGMDDEGMEDDGPGHPLDELMSGECQSQSGE